MKRTLPRSNRIVIYVELIFEFVNYKLILLLSNGHNVLCNHLNMPEHMWKKTILQCSLCVIAMTKILIKQSLIIPVLDAKLLIGGNAGHHVIIPLVKQTP